MQYVIEHGYFLYGPFLTAQQAYEWGIDMCAPPITIRELRNTSELGPRDPRARGS